MEKGKLLFIGPISQKREVIGGATIKNRCLIDYLNKNNIKLKILDTDNWQKNILFILIKLFYFLLFRNEKKIVLSTSAKGTYYFLRFFYIFNWRKKEIYFFQVGGTTTELLEKKIYDIRFFKNITKIYVETNKMVEILKKLGLNQVEYLPNFKNFEIKDRSKKKINIPLQIVFFSRIEEEKGIELIFNMLSIVNREKIKVKVDFYGPIQNNYKNIFEEKIKNYEEVRYCGILNPKEEKTYDILGKYDLMLFPTCYENEGIPGSIIDALISSLPIIAARWKNYQQVLDKKISYSFEIKNQKELNKLMESILENPKIILTMRKNCFEESKKYNTKTVLKKVINEILK